MNGNKLSGLTPLKKTTLVSLAGLVIFGLAVFFGMSKTASAPVVTQDEGATLDAIVSAPESVDEIDSLQVEADTILLEEQGTDTDGDTVTVEIPDAVPESTVPEPVYKLETITLAGGCFWCIEGALQDVEGVIDAVSGYSGGEASTANYLTVSKGKTDHKEVVQITYDTNIISTERILNNFWSAIDPADAGGQFADRGPHYTTAIFYHTDEQRKIAETSKANLNTSGLVDGEVVTEILPFTNFYRAEEYHQDYYKKSAERYKRYEKASGRAGFVEDTWAREDAIAFFEEQANSAAE